MTRVTSIANEVRVAADPVRQTTDRRGPGGRPAPRGGGRSQAARAGRSGAPVSVSTAYALSSAAVGRIGRPRRATLSRIQASGIGRNH